MSTLIEKLGNVEKIASASKFRRMLTNPFKYFRAILFRELIYKKQKREKEIIAETFFGVKMHLLLPSSTDIYLTGGKSHDSEIRLAKFLINHLKSGDILIDVGAHYGYFTLLAAELVGHNGAVYSFEASPETYNIFNRNTAHIAYIKGYNLAVSDEISELKFYEFPNLYSENNTLDIELFQNEKWFSEYKPKEIDIKSVILDDFIPIEQVNPKIIKIDVEGAEYKVINGLRNYLSKNAPIIVMEYLSDIKRNKQHREAEKILDSLGYTPFIIDNIGNIKQIEEISKYLDCKELDSENIVFAKHKSINK